MFGWRSSGAAVIAVAATSLCGLATEARADCTYSSSSGTNYWTCASPYPANLPLTNSPDVLTLGTGQNITGDVEGRSDADQLTIDGGTVGGEVDGGANNDTLLLNSGTVTGKFKGGSGNDTITVKGGTVMSNVEGDDGWDTVNIEGGDIKGTVIGDVINISGGTIEGDVSGGNAGADNIITVTGGTVLGTIYAYAGADTVTLNGGTVNTVSGGTGADTILIKPLTGLVVNGHIVGGDGQDAITFDGAVEGVNLTFPDRYVDGGDDRDSVSVIGGSALTLTTVTNFGELFIKGSSLTLDGSSYIIGSSVAYGVVDLDGTSTLALTAGTVSLSTRNFKLGNVSSPGAVLAIGRGTATAATITAAPGGAFSNYGTIDLADGVANDALTLQGAYLGGATPGGANGAAGNVRLDVATWGSSGAADSFVLTGGTVTGTTTIQVVARGKGGLTGNGAESGILVVDASGATSLGPDAFQLAVNPLTGRRDVIAGAFDYTLVESGGDYYLQSSLLSQVPAYVAGPSVAANYAFMAFNTLSRRLGELRQGDVLPGAGGDWQAWGRAFGGSVDVSPSQGWGFSQDAAISQFGFDRRVEIGAPGQLHLGVFAGYGRTDATIAGTTGTSASLDGWSAGAYATLFSEGKPGLGAFVDLVAKADFLNAAFSAVTGSGATDTQSYGVSAEVGYGFALGQGLVLQPQAELTYLNTHQDGFVDSLGLAVNGATLEDLVGRIGLQLQSTILAPDGAAHTPYLTANVLHDFLGDGAVTVADTAFDQSPGGTWYTLGAGITSNIRANVALYAQAAYAMGDVEGWTGNLGLRARW